MYHKPWIDGSHRAWVWVTLFPDRCLPQSGFCNKHWRQSPKYFFHNHLSQQNRSLKDSRWYRAGCYPSGWWSCCAINWQFSRDLPCFQQEPVAICMGSGLLAPCGQSSCPIKESIVLRCPHSWQARALTFQGSLSLKQVSKPSWFGLCGFLCHGSL